MHARPFWSAGPQQPGPASPKQQVSVLWPAIVQDRVSMQKGGGGVQGGVPGGGATPPQQGRTQI
jgi:hypothetical protein